MQLENQTRELCGREVPGGREKHLRRHLDNAVAYLDLIATGGEDPGWSATAWEWIERCERALAALDDAERVN